MKRKPSPRFRQLVLIACCIAAIPSLSGCATFSFPFGKRVPLATAADPAVQVLCMWQPAKGHDADGYPCRGFSGQILFLSGRTSTPLRVDGDVRIYLFDDQGTPEEQAKPLRQFDYTNGAWDLQLGMTSLGTTYGVFVPYVRRGVNEAQCSLRVRLKPRNGPVVFSDFSTMPLNATKKVQKGAEAKPMSEEEVDEIAVEAMTTTLRRTTTITMNPEDKSSGPQVEDSKAKKSSSIQLASHEEPAASKSATSESDRIRELEATVQKLRDQQDRQRTAPPNQFVADEELTALNNDSSPVRTEPSRPSRRFRLRSEKDDSPASNTAAHKTSHPLDDDDSSVSKTRSASLPIDKPPTRNPLEAVDDAEDDLSDRLRYRRPSR